MPLFGGPPNIKKLEAKRDVNGLIKALEYHKDIGRTPSTAAEALGRIGDPRAVEPLIAALRDGATPVRWSAAEALGLLGDARAVEPLIARLDNRTDSVFRVIEALGLLGDARAVGPLLKFLGDYASDKDRVSERRVANEAIIQIGPPAIPALVAVLENHKGSLRIREAAAMALGQTGDVRAVEPLVAALADRDVCRAAVKALDDLAWQPDRGTSGAAYWAAKGEWDKCVEIGAPAVKPLTAALRDENRGTRKAAAGALGRLAWKPTLTADGAAYLVAEGEWDECVKIGAPAVLPLIAALDGDENMRAGAVGALVQIGAPAVEPLLAALKEGRVFWDTDWELDVAVVRALVRIGDPRAADKLLDALTGTGFVLHGRPLDTNSREPWEMRKAAAEGLVALYQSGRLNEAQKAKLLAQRGAITSSHQDDYAMCGGHTDKGDGVAFPI